MFENMFQNMLSRREPTTGCMTRKPKVVLFQRTWLQNASSQVIGCLKRDFSLKIHSSSVMCTQESTHPLLQQLPGPELMPWIKLIIFFVSSDVNYCWASKGEVLFSFGILSWENTRLLQVAMCSVVANVMASSPQKKEDKSRTGQVWAPPMCCVTAAITTRPAERRDVGKPLVWSAVLFSIPVSLKCVSNTMLRSNMD